MTELNTTYAKAKTDEVEDYYTQKLPAYDDPSTTKRYDCWDVEISKAELKELVDIERALVMFRALYTSGKKETAQEDYKRIWLAIKTRVGTGPASESLASKFNNTYCMDERAHYVHYLVRPRNPPASMKPWVFEHRGKSYLRVWYRK